MFSMASYLQIIASVMLLLSWVQGIDALNLDKICGSANGKGCHASDEITGCPSQFKYKTVVNTPEGKQAVCCCECIDGECTKNNTSETTCWPKEIGCKDLVVSTANMTNETDATSSSDIAEAVNATVRPMLEHLVSTASADSEVPTTPTPVSTTDVLPPTSTSAARIQRNDHSTQITRPIETENRNLQSTDIAIIASVISFVVGILVAGGILIIIRRKKLCCFKPNPGLDSAKGNEHEVHPLTESGNDSGSSSDNCNRSTHTDESA